jgi:polyferredoxin
VCTRSRRPLPSRRGIRCSPTVCVQPPVWGGVAQPEQSLSAALETPPLVLDVRYGVPGPSRFATRLRRDIREARQSGANVLLRGEPGLHKDRLAALAHFGSASARAGAPLVRLDCAGGTLLKPWRLFGLVDDDGVTQLRFGALDWLAAQPRGGTLLLDGVHVFTEDGSTMVQGIARLLEDGQYFATDRHGRSVGAPKRVPNLRVLLTADVRIASAIASVGLENGLITVSVPPLRVRKADLPSIAGFFLRQLCAERWGKRTRAPSIARDARHLLESAEFADNERELEVLLKGAIAHSSGLGVPSVPPTPSRPPAVVDASLLWSPAWSRRLSRESADLFTWFPALRAAWRSPLWPEWINQNVTRWMFPLVVGMLLLGPQTRDANPALNVFWCYWWPLALATFPVVGRLWCAVCPFSIYGDWAQRIKLAAGGTVEQWPRQAAEQYGGWFLYALFGAILLWEELCDLPNNAAQSGLLLLLITGGAVAGSLMYERRFWCRYLCPIGGMNGMFAKLAFVELRADRGVCTAECSSYACIKGGAGQPPGQPGYDRGLATAGCPLNSHPASLPDNRDCTFCGSCVKACPNGNIQFRLRPAGADLWEEHTATRHEAALMFMLLGAIGMHDAPHLTDIVGIPPETVASIMHNPLAHGALSAAILLCPGVAALSVDTLLSAFGSGRSAPQLRAPVKDPVDSFVRLSYGWLPLVWAASLAYYMRLFGEEAGLVVSTAASGLLHWPADSVPHAALAPAVISFLQAASLLLGGGAATALTWKLGTEVAPSRAVGQAAGIACAGLVLWRLIVRADFLLV